MRFEDLAGQRVVIWGAGREGRAALTALAERGVAATIAVTGAAEAPGDLAGVAVAGEDAVIRLTGAEVVVKSPGVPHTDPLFGRLEALGVSVTSLTDLWLNANADRVIGVTGTKGKSTTSALIHHLLNGTGTSAVLVGNGGTPVSTGDRSGSAVAVAEVSSYQAADLSVSPRLAVVVSLFPEHLPWHGGYDAYVHDKLNLVAHRPDVVVVPDLTGEIARLVQARVAGTTRVVCPATVGIEVTDTTLTWAGVGAVAEHELPLRGRHNLVNLALALTAAASWTGAGPADRVRLLDQARTFPPLAHRLEQVASADSRAWVDDSLATAPEAVVAALETYESVRVVLIAGGADRGLSFAPLIDYLEQRRTPVTVLAIGPAGARLAAEAGDRVDHLRVVAGFAAAIEAIHQDPSASDVVLLSPGAPSFDEFTSYEERSAAFRTAAAGTAG